MKIHDFEIPDPKFNLRETVWISLDPRRLTSIDEDDKTLAFQCNVLSISAELKIGINQDPEYKFNYHLDMEGFLQTTRVSEDEVYRTEAEACKAGLQRVIDAQKRSLARSESLTRIVSNMKEKARQ